MGMLCGRLKEIFLEAKPLMANEKTRTFSASMAVAAIARETKNNPP
jgi:hypothetical protein